MQDWTLSWEDVSPLFQDGWQGTAAALEVVGHPQVLAVLQRISRRVWRRDDARRHFTEPEDLAQEAIALIARRLDGSQGVPRPASWTDRPTPEGTVVNYLASRVKDAARVRKMDAAQAASLDTKETLEKGPSADRVPSTAPDAFDAVARSQRAALLGATMQAAAAQVPPQHLLAWLCLHVPEQVVPAQVDAAEAHLPRTTDETWAHLRPWAETVIDPDDRSGRRFVAWLLRSDAPPPPDAWHDAEPAAGKTARDTVSKWSKRCQARLRDIATDLSSDGGPS